MLDNDFLDSTPKAKSIDNQIDKCDLKFKTSALENTVKKMKR
jgi:hypothetical protein